MIKLNRMENFLEFVRTARSKAAVLAYDTLAASVAFLLAANFALTRELVPLAFPLPVSVLGNAGIFGFIAAIMAYAMGLHRGIWRYTSLVDCLKIVRMATLTVLFYLPVVFLATRAVDLPRSVPVLAWILTVAFLAGPRIVARALGDRRIPNPFEVIRHRDSGAAAAVPAIVVGDASRAEVFVRELQRRPEVPYEAAAILTYEANWHRRRIHGVQVMGSPDMLGAAIAELAARNVRPQRLIIADDAADKSRVALFLELAAQHGLTVGKLPRLMDLRAGDEDDLVQPVALGDLLGRPQAVLNREAMASLVGGRRVLVTGAGGSIGSELCRQIAALRPERLVMADDSEFNLYSIGREIADRYPGQAMQEVLCDVRVRQAVEHLFAAECPQIVFHAAALKHVPLVEANAVEGIRTNVLGTQHVADACTRFGALAMVLISTDKAVNPHNIMGATKRLAEAYCQAMDSEVGRTRFVAVRFGNVLGSTGSVVPLFQRQLAAGGPLTVTHPEISRYFMTIPEAVQLVLQASARGIAPDARRGAVYVLDMGRPIRIADLARQMIRLSGKRPDIDVKIEFIGLRPGEKLHEELVHPEETLEDTSADGVMMVSPRTSSLPILRQQLQELRRTCGELDTPRAVQLLRAAVPELARAEAPRVASRS